MGAGKIQVAVDGQVDFTPRRKLIMALFTATFLLMVYAVIPFDEMGLPLPVLGWWFPELSAPVPGRRRDHRPHRPDGGGGAGGDLCGRCADLLGVAFIIGISRGITVLMNDGAITDTILHWGETALAGAGPVAFTLLVFLLYLPLSVLIPSSSGLATLSIPVVAPLGKFAESGGRPGGDGLPVRLRPVGTSSPPRRRW